MGLQAYELYYAVHGDNLLDVIPFNDLKGSEKKKWRAAAARLFVHPSVTKADIAGLGGLPLKCIAADRLAEAAALLKGLPVRYASELSVQSQQDMAALIAMVLQRLR